MIIHLETKCVQTMSTHPNENWMGDGWVLVPPELEDKARELAPYCALALDGDGSLTDITDDGTRPEPGEDDTTERELSPLELLETRVAVLEEKIKAIEKESEETA